MVASLLLMHRLLLLLLLLLLWPWLLFVAGLIVADLKKKLNKSLLKHGALHISRLFVRRQLHPFYFEIIFIV